MTATSLSAGPVLGTLSASGSSPVFSTVANQAAIVVIGPSRLASSITPALMRSIDGGSTWAPVTLIQQQAFDYPSTFFIATLLDASSAQYRIDATLTAGSVFFCARPATGQLFFRKCTLIEPGDAIGSGLSMTTAQYQSLYSNILVPLTTAQVAAPLTLYKQCRSGVIAKLNVPSGAPTGFDNSCAIQYGQNRIVRASSVQVVSLVDANGNSVSTGISYSDTGTTYTPGSTVTARDLYAGTPQASSGTFDSATYKAGIYGFTTQIEAACMFVPGVPVNLAALGL